MDDGKTFNRVNSIRTMMHRQYEYGTIWGSNSTSDDDGWSSSLLCRYSTLLYVQKHFKNCIWNGRKHAACVDSNFCYEVDKKKKKKLYFINEEMIE